MKERERERERVKAGGRLGSERKRVEEKGVDRRKGRDGKRQENKLRRGGMKKERRKKKRK